MNEASESSSAPAVLLPFPDHRDLYLLVAGIVVGVLLSSAVLGRVAPDLYDRLFIGAGSGPEQIQAMLQEQQNQLQALAATGVTGAALQEQEAVYEQALAPLRAQVEQARQQADRWLISRMTGLILAILAVMIVEIMVSPQPQAGKPTVVSPVLRRLITVRYALISVWLALALARPVVLQQLPLLFIALVVGVSLLAAFVPLGRRES